MSDFKIFPSGAFYIYKAGKYNPRATLGDYFASATGVYILATPTANDTSDKLSGMWFLDNSSGMPMEGLNLPGLPSGWVYESWAGINGTPVT